MPSIVTTLVIMSFVLSFLDLVLFLFEFGNFSVIFGFIRTTQSRPVPANSRRPPREVRNEMGALPSAVLGAGWQKQNGVAIVLPWLCPTAGGAVNLQHQLERPSVACVPCRPAVRRPLLAVCGACRDPFAISAHERIHFYQTMYLSIS